MQLENLVEIRDNYEHTPGIYCITINDYIVYIGQSKDIYQRAITHFAMINNPFLAQDSEKDKYYYLHERADSVKMTILWVQDTDDNSTRYKNETKLIKHYNPPLNKACTTHPKDINWIELARMDLKWLKIWFSITEQMM